MEKLDFCAKSAIYLEDKGMISNSIKCVYKDAYWLSFGAKIDDLEWPWVDIQGHANYSTLFSQMVLQTARMSTRLYETGIAKRYICFNEFLLYLLNFQSSCPFCCDNSCNDPDLTAVMQRPCGWDTMLATASTHRWHNDILSGTLDRTPHSSVSIHFLSLRMCDA